MPKRKYEGVPPTNATETISLDDGLPFACPHCGEPEEWNLAFRQQTYEWVNLKVYVVGSTCVKGNYRLGASPERNGYFSSSQDLVLLRDHRPELFKALVTKLTARFGQQKANAPAPVKELSVQERAKLQAEQIRQMREREKQNVNRT